MLDGSTLCLSQIHESFGMTRTASDRARLRIVRDARRTVSGRRSGAPRRHAQGRRESVGEHDHMVLLNALVLLGTVIDPRFWTGSRQFRRPRRTRGEARADPPEAKISVDPLITRWKEVVDGAAEEPGELPRACNGDRRVPVAGDIADVRLRHTDLFSNGHLGDTREGDRGGYTPGWRRGTKNGQLSAR